MVCVASLNEIVATHEPPFMTFEYSDNTFYMSLYMVFGILWITAWIEYANFFIVMVGAATYYFNSDGKHGTEGSAELLKGFKFAYLRHTGSLAFGAAIIATIRFIRIIFTYIAQKAEKASGDNQVVKCVIACGACCLKCIETVLDYLNKSAFAYMAVTGDSFCTSAWNGFLL